MKLTYKEKTLTADDKQAVVELKERMLIECLGRCSGKDCNKSLTLHTAQMSHIIPKGKRTYKKFGYEAINHEKNIKIACDKCNSSIMRSDTAYPEESKEHMREIYDDLGADFSLIQW